MFLGYCSKQHGYKCLDSDERVYVYKDVRFHEHVLSFADKKGKFMVSYAPKHTCTSLPCFLTFGCTDIPPDNCNMSPTCPRPSDITSLSVSSCASSDTSPSCVLLDQPDKVFALAVQPLLVNTSV